MASSEWLGRRLRSLAALGIASLGFLTGCTFNFAESNSLGGDLYRRYNAHMENRAQRRLADQDSITNKIRYSQDDSFIRDSYLQDGMTGNLGGLAKEEKMEGAQREIIGVMRRAGGDTLKDALRGNLGSATDYFVPELDGDENQPLIGAYGPAPYMPESSANQSRQSNKRGFRLKVTPGLHRVAYGARIGPIEIKGAKRYTDQGNTLETDFKLNQFLLDNMYLHGGFDRDFDKDKQTMKFGLQYEGLSAGAQYSVDKREEKEERRDLQFLLQFSKDF